MSIAFLAVDLGAESGRVMVATLDEGRLSLHEAHRFANQTVCLPSGLHWGITALWHDVCQGLRVGGEWCRQQGRQVASVGVDTWGVDWALLGRSGELLGLPHAYRDPRNPAAYAQALAKLTRQDIYHATGIQLLPINSLFSLYAQYLADPSLLETATQLLFIPDLLNYWLSGQSVNEATIASTSQLLDVRTKTWCNDLLRKLGMPDHLPRQTIVEPGTVLGPLRGEVAELVGLSPETLVIAPATHDTASAVVAVPVDRDTTQRWCYLSSGTWSLLGAELSTACITDASAAAGFTNELGYDGKFRFLKNIVGLWLVQECRRQWQLQGHEADYADLTQQAAAAVPFRTLIDATHAGLQSPGQMLTKIADLAAAAGEPIPRTPGEFVRCCLESLAFAYRDALRSMQQVLECQFHVIHIVGGGSRSELLNQMTANATGLPVIAGPSEATAIGNALVQAIALGEVRDLQAARDIVSSSSETVTYQPAEHEAWVAAGQRVA